jgi:hypothetical protein
MSNAITADDVDARLYEAAAATSRTNSSIKKNVTIFTIAADLWKVNRSLKQLVEMCEKFNTPDTPGAISQRIEKLLTDLIEQLERCIAISRTRGLFNRTLTAGSLHSICVRLEDLKDIWVALSSSTDAELDDALKLAAQEISVDWESVRH